eukprot:8662690-Pyramimonas_sp.AAC.1
MDKEVESTPAQPVHVEPLPRPIVVRPTRAPGASQAQARTGAPNRTCRTCAEHSTEVCKGCLKRMCKDHLDMGANRCDECAWRKTLGHQGDREKRG